MSHQFRLANWNEDSSPTRDARVAASNYPTLNRSISQFGVAASNYHQVQSRTGNSNNNGSSTSFNSGRNNNVATSATITSTGIGNVSFKRSRSPDFVRGESSNQGSQVGGSSRRRTNPPPTPTFQQESVNNNNMSPMSSTPLSKQFNCNGNMVFSSMLQPQVNQYGINATQNFITSDSHIINRRHAHAGPSGFFDDTPSYNTPSQSIIGDDVSGLLFASRQEIPRASFTMTRRTEPTPSFTSSTSFYPSAMIGGTTHVAASTSPFQRNINFLSLGDDSSSSSPSPGWGFNGFNNTNNTNTSTNLDLFDSVQQRIDDTSLDNTIHVQQYARLLPRGHVNRFLAPSIVPMQSNSYVTRQPQPPSDPPTRTYLLNPYSPPHRPGFSTTVEFEHYMQTGTLLDRPGNRRRGNNRIFTSTSPELRARRNRLRDEIVSSLQHLRSGGSMRIEDMLMLDYSIVLNVFNSQEHIDMLHSIDDRPYESVLALEEHIRRVETGLTEEEIDAYIETETHMSNPNETSTQNETCTICQEDFVEGEIIGRLDCMHIYHLECIKQWLLQKNVCPNCKQIALDVHEDEDESD